MTVANVLILHRRGNLAVSNVYTGPAGEITVDTTLRSIRVHDGVTPGGKDTLTNKKTHQFTVMPT